MISGAKSKASIAVVPNSATFDNFMAQSNHSNIYESDNQYQDENYYAPPVPPTSTTVNFDDRNPMSRDTSDITGYYNASSNFYDQGASTGDTRFDRSIPNHISMSNMPDNNMRRKSTKDTLKKILASTPVVSPHVGIKQLKFRKP
jgi:hypothetical protein